MNVASLAKQYVTELFLGEESMTPADAKERMLAHFTQKVQNSTNTGLVGAATFMASSAAMAVLDDLPCDRSIVVDVGKITAEIERRERDIFSGWKDLGPRGYRKEFADASERQDFIALLKDVGIRARNLDPAIEDRNAVNLSTSCYQNLCLLWQGRSSEAIFER